MNQQSPVNLLPVIVVGGGPVGLTCAMDMAQRGIDVLVLEQRQPFEKPEPRANHVSARSMEIFRKLGVAAAVRDAGLPHDHPHDVVYTTALVGRELGRVRIPPRAKRFADAGYADGGWPTPEPPHRINQSFLEPVLMQHATQVKGLTTRWNFRFDGLEQHEGFVRVQGTDLVTGQAQTLDALYVVGCDGSRSGVRKALGVEFRGQDNLMGAMMATVTLPDLPRHETLGRGWMYWVMNPKQAGCIMALDGRDQWIVNPFVPLGADADKFDFEAAARTMLGVDIPFTVQFKKPWIGRRLLSERFSVGRVFLCGDAAHSWLPMAGYGMNAGIADAANLSWKLAAVLNGWADADLLESYHDERHPVLEQVSAMVMKVRQNNAVTIPPEIDDDGPAGEAARERVARYMMEIDSPQFACIGLNFGYYYEHSQAIALDPEQAAPAYSMGQYQPSTVPGCRMPHVWLDGHTSLYDHLGDGLTLIRLDKLLPIDSLLAAARLRQIPLKVLDVPAHTLAPELQLHGLLLVRPDQHIAWRGQNSPASPAAALVLLDVLRGVAKTPMQVLAT